MHTTTRRIARTIASAITGTLLATWSLASTAQTLKVGVTPGALADSVQVAIQEAKKQGLDVKLVEFTDWTTPNEALASGDIDVNYFQHQAFYILKLSYKTKIINELQLLLLIHFVVHNRFYDPLLHHF